MLAGLIPSTEGWAGPGSAAPILPFFSPRRPISKCLFLSTPIQQLTHNARPSLIFSKVIMNINSLRSSKSSYGDPRYLSTVTASDGQPPPLAKALVDGYRDALNPQNGDRSRYNPLNSVHPRSSALLNANDPITMYLLTETAMGDSMSYEVLSYEEVEDLKKENKLLSNRIEGTKRKLALEIKLRDAAQSLGRLYNPESPRSSGEYGANGHRRSRSFFGRNGATDASSKSGSELAIAQRKCEELAQELWRLERRAQQIHQRLLEHTAGVLQMTHKGLKKPPKDRNSESVYDGHEFDDRSLYRTPEHLDGMGWYGKDTNGSAPMSMGAVQSTERRLEELSERLRNMVLRSNPDGDFDSPPQLSGDGGPVNPMATVEAHLMYIENGLDALSSGAGVAAPAPETEDSWRHQLADVNKQLQVIVDRFGLTRSPTLPPPPDASQGDGLQELLSYLQAGVDGLESRVNGLLEQKGILTTQIQQQRELNSKSDAERDAHINDLNEQLTQLQRDLESSRAEMELIRADGAPEDKAAAAEELREARERAEQEVGELEAAMQQLRAESDERVKEALDQRAQVEEELQQANEARAHAEEEANRLQSEMTDLESELARVTTELTMVKAELDGAYGSRAERATEAAVDPEIQNQIDALSTRNIELTEELATLKGQQGGGDLQQRANTLEKELRETLDDYEAMTKASIEFEKERERFEGVIDNLRERTEQLEMQLNEERINHMNLNSPGSMGREGTSETTSTMVLKNEFKKMMRDTRNENMKILKAEQEERRRIEGLLRSLRKEHAQATGKPLPSPGAPL
ncbi:hypothetical protein N7474_006844 [Penicillium riverlandense]|uniref:uncharacterized protein n=1 Tax=Penicillium riverlandense TaxID=1903569 RepID=UPI0025469ED1|nr:uncharacterized protein N7474_006844 [Penicillium riverlandense]KAJ5815067.1 hypothetical protein N7474_006844 [Penicillium riverlandense]